MLRMGTDLGMLPAAESKVIDTLLMEIQPAHLQISAQRKLTAEERDILRAEVLRRRLASLPEPLTNISAGPPPEDPPLI